MISARVLTMLTPRHIMQLAASLNPPPFGVQSPPPPRVASPMYTLQHAAFDLRNRRTFFRSRVPKGARCFNVAIVPQGSGVKLQTLPMSTSQSAGLPQNLSNSMNSFDCDIQKLTTLAHEHCPADNLSSEADPAELPLIAYTMIARALPLADLPTLRLVSKAWCTAASGAVQKLGTDVSMTVGQVRNLSSMLKIFPCLSEVRMPMAQGPFAQSALAAMSQISGLQTLALGCSVGQSPLGLQFILQQSKLTSLCLNNFFTVGGIQDSALHSIGSVQSLISLDLDLSSATDDGISGLKLLTNLQSLRLPLSKLDKNEVTRHSLSVVVALNHLTCLSLISWPIRDGDLVSMTSLASLQHLDLSECTALLCLCFMPLLQFPYLRKLDTIRSDHWLNDPIVDTFELLKPSVELQF